MAGGDQRNLWANLAFIVIVDLKVQNRSLPTTGLVVYFSIQRTSPFIDHSSALLTSDEGFTTTPTRPVRDILGEHQHQSPLPGERKIIHFFKIGGNQLSNRTKYSLSLVQKIWQGLKRLGDKAFLHTVSAPRSPRFLFGLVMANQKQFYSVTPEHDPSVESNPPLLTGSNLHVKTELSQPQCPSVLRTHKKQGGKNLFGSEENTALFRADDGDGGSVGER